jgi:hypothetical protein
MPHESMRDQVQELAAQWELQCSIQGRGKENCPLGRGGSHESDELRPPSEDSFSAEWLRWRPWRPWRQWSWRSRRPGKPTQHWSLGLEGHTSFSGLSAHQDGGHQDLPLVLQALVLVRRCTCGMPLRRRGGCCARWGHQCSRKACL